MSTYPVRLGALAGWLALAGLVVGVIVLPSLIAGLQPAASASPAELQNYYSHSELAILNGYVNGFVTMGFVAFAIGLRAVLGVTGERARAFADVGLALVVIAMGLNLASGAIVAALVGAAGSGGADLSTLTRLQDVTYNGLGDVLEGGWVGAFSIAMLGGAQARWLGWFGIALAIAHWLKALGPFADLPEAVDLLIGPLIVLWILAALVGLTKVALRGNEPDRASIVVPA